MLRRLLIFALAALLITPSASFAAQATQDGYGDSDDVAVQAETDSGADEPADTSDSLPETASAQPTASTGDSLPFTGFEAGLIAAAGIGLAGTGVALRRAAREQQ